MGDSFVLRTDRLRVTVAAPGVAPNVTTRFDRAGFITSVLLDGAHEFCTREPDGLWHPCTGGMGLCSEFQCAAPADEAAEGEKFAKFGVGLLTQTADKGYVFHTKYECEPFGVTAEQLSEREVVFDTAALPCGGYALRQRKTLRLEGAALTVAYEVENVGEKAVTFTEYCHNFVTIDRLPLGPGYRLEFPTVRDLTGRTSTTGESTLLGEGRAFSFTGAVPAAEMSGIEREDFEAGAVFREGYPFGWKLSHSESPAWMSEATDFLPANVPLWFIDHMVSPEVMMAATVEPGAKLCWTRVYEFGC